MTQNNTKTEQQDSSQCPPLPLPDAKETPSKRMLIKDANGGVFAVAGNRADARLIVAAVNAIAELAKAQGVNPVLLAERLAGGGLLAMWGVVNRYEAAVKELIEIANASICPPDMQSRLDDITANEYANEELATALAIIEGK